MTEGLLTVSRKQVVSPKVLDLNALISEQIKMLTRLIPENIELRFIAGDIARVKAYPSQVQCIQRNVDRPQERRSGDFAPSVRGRGECPDPPSSSDLNLSA